LFIFCATDQHCLHCDVRRLAEECALGYILPFTERVSGVDCKHDIGCTLGECRARQVVQMIRLAQRVAMRASHGAAPCRQMACEDDRPCSLLRRRVGADPIA
jgi:hypothetical protein